MKIRNPRNIFIFFYFIFCRVAGKERIVTRNRKMSNYESVILFFGDYGDTKNYFFGGDYRQIFGLNLSLNLIGYFSEVGSHFVTPKITKYIRIKIKHHFDNSQDHPDHANGN